MSKKRDKEIWNVPPTQPTNLQSRLQAKVAPLKHQRKALTGREWKFVQELVANDGEVTLKEAAIRAGYPERGAARRAYELTHPDRNPHVVAAIQSYRSELAAKYGTTFERHMKDLQKIRDAALQAGAYSAAVSAEYRRGQALGTIYVERKEVRFGTIDSMSKEEVMRKLDELKALYGAGGAPPKDIIDLNPTDVVSTIEYDPPFDEKEVLNASETGSGVISTAPRESGGLPDHAD